VPDPPERHVAIGGASGLIGSALVPLLEAAGWRVSRLVRRPAREEAEIAWDPSAGRIDRGRLAGVDAVINLAGESIAGIWTAERKRRIRDSRVRATRLIAETLAAQRGSRVLVNASAVGYYGDCSDRVVDESAGPGAGFLAETCVAWEAATAAASAAGHRVVRARIGVVLTPAGGALRRMLLPFRLGLGGVVGDGRQYTSWISSADLVRALVALLEDGSISGPVNVVAPEPVTNAELTRALGRVLRLPTVLPLPAFAVRLALGEMGRELLLSSTRAVPARLVEAGFRFDHPVVDAVLREALGARGA